jgi:anti-sigma factor RsiW
VNCRQFEHFMDQYLDGDLGGSLKLEFEAHLVECEGCGHLYAMMDSAGAILASPSPDEPRISTGFADRVLAEVQVRRAKPVKFRKFLHRVSAAAGVVLMITGMFVYSQNRKAVSPGPQAVGPLMASRTTDEAGRQDINQWLAGTLEEAGSSLWELKELQSAAVSQVKQGLFESLTGPATISETAEIAKEQNTPAKPAENPTPQESQLAGLELL